METTQYRVFILFLVSPELAMHIYIHVYYSGVLKTWRNNRPTKCKVDVSDLLSTSVDRVNVDTPSNRITATV